MRRIAAIPTARAELGSARRSRLHAGREDWRRRQLRRPPLDARRDRDTGHTCTISAFGLAGRECLPSPATYHGPGPATVVAPPMATRMADYRTAWRKSVSLGSTTLWPTHGDPGSWQRTSSIRLSTDMPTTARPRSCDHRTPAQMARPSIPAMVEVMYADVEKPSTPQQAMSVLAI